MYKFEELYDKNHQNIPRLPIPNLDYTLDRYLRSLGSVGLLCDFWADLLHTGVC